MGACGQRAVLGYNLNKLKPRPRGEAGCGAGRVGGRGAGCFLSPHVGERRGSAPAPTVTGAGQVRAREFPGKLFIADGNLTIEAGQQDEYTMLNWVTIEPSN